MSKRATTTSAGCATLRGILIIPLLLGTASASASQWSTPPGYAPPVRAPAGAKAVVGGITFDEAEFAPFASVDGLVVTTLGGAPLPAPLSFSCTTGGVAEPGCDINSGPGAQAFVDGQGIEAPTTAVLGVHFGMDVGSVSFGFALSCPPPVSPGVTLTAFDAVGDPVGTLAVDAVDTGFGFAENEVTFDGVGFRSIGLSFNGVGGCTAFLVDNLVYGTSPQVAVSKSSVTAEVPETGQAVVYSFLVENPGSEAFSIASLTDDQFGALAGDADCQVGTSLAGGSSCGFDASFAVPPGVTGTSFVNSFTAEVVDAFSASASSSDAHTVTYTDVPPLVSATKSSAVATISELGGNVSYTFAVENSGGVSFALSSLQDDQFGTLAGDADCQAATVLAPGASCDFTVAFAVPPGTVGGTFVNTFSAGVTDLDGTTGSDSDAHVLTYTDVAPQVTASKSAIESQVPETGATVSYTFMVQNSGLVAFTIASLQDNPFGALPGDADCQVGTALAPGTSCEFTAAFDVPAGTTGGSFVNAFTVGVADADGSTASDDDDHTVGYAGVAPQLAASKTSGDTEVPETGGEVSYTFAVQNTGTVAFTVASLVDVPFGPLPGDADCQVGTTLPPGAGCSFDAAFTIPAGAVGATFLNTFEVAIEDADAATATAAAGHSVTYVPAQVPAANPQPRVIPALSWLGLLSTLVLVLGTGAVAFRH